MTSRDLEVLHNAGAVLGLEGWAGWRWLAAGARVSQGRRRAGKHKGRPSAALVC